MKTARRKLPAFLLALLFGSLSAATASPTIYNMDGIVTAYSVMGIPQLEGVISVGNPLSGSLFYEPLAEVGPITYDVSIGGHSFLGTSAANTLFLTDGGPDGDQIVYYNLFVSDLDISPPAFSKIFLTDRSGRALSSGALPETLNLADWPDQHSIVFVSDNAPGTRQFVMTVNITSLTAVPEPNPSMLLTLGFVSLAIVKRFSRGSASR